MALSCHVLLLQEESAFTGVASQCLSVLVLGINTHLDACLQVGPEFLCLLQRCIVHRKPFH